MLTATNAGNGRGLAGFSDSWQGVYGHSNENAGIVGESLNFDGVYGVSQSATHAAVSAHNDGFGGFGVWAAGGDVANGTAAIHGGSAKGNAVEGISAKNTASGVYGQNDATGYGVAGRATNGTGVLADSANGWALKASGNATQSRAGSGFVKAMAFIDPFNSADPIRQCFNSQLPPSQATSGDCDIIYTKISTGYYNFDFGFQVNDRFVSVTPARYLSEMTVLPTGTNTQWDVVTSGPSDNRFFIFVY